MHQTGPVASFLPPALPARAKTRGGGSGSVAASCTEGNQAYILFSLLPVLCMLPTTVYTTFFPACARVPVCVCVVVVGQLLLFPRNYRGQPFLPTICTKMRVIVRFVLTAVPVSCPGWLALAAILMSFALSLWSAGATRRSTFGAPVCSTRLGATTDQPEGHALREAQEANSIDGAKAGSSTEQESPSVVATLDTPVAAAADAAGDADSAEGRSSEVGGEGRAEQAPSMVAVGQEVEVDKPAAGAGQCKEEQEVMEELLAQQPGGQEETAGGQGDDGAPEPIVSAGDLGVVLRVPPGFQVRKRVLSWGSKLEHVLRSIGIWYCPRALDGCSGELLQAKVFLPRLPEDKKNNVVVQSGGTIRTIRCCCMPLLHSSNNQKKTVG